jgi:rhomboid protease GluP
MLAGPRIKPKLTILLIAINVAVYAYTSIVGGNFLETNDRILQRYGQDNEAVLTQGAYWQLFTSMFVHVNLPHLILNMLFFLILGLRSEELFKGGEFLFIYLVSGFAGNLLTLLLPDVVSAGASGAIFGVFGASVIYTRKAFGMPIFTALVYSFLFLIFSVSEGVNLFAHLGGLVAGLVLGYFLAKSRKTNY